MTAMTKRRDELADKRSKRQCSSGNPDLDRAISWFLKIGFEDGWDACQAEMQAQNEDLNEKWCQALEANIFLTKERDDLKAQVDELKKSNLHHIECCDLHSQRNLLLTKEIEALSISVNTYDKINESLKVQLDAAVKGLNKISDACQCETDDRDICFGIAVKALEQIQKMRGGPQSKSDCRIEGE